MLRKKFLGSILGFLAGIGFMFCEPVFANVQGESLLENYLPGALYVKLSGNSVGYEKSSNRYCPITVLFPVKSERDVYGFKPMAYSMHLFGNKVLDNVFRIEFDSVHKTEILIEALKKDSRFVFVEKVPRHTIQIQPRHAEKANSLPDDSFFGNIDSIPTSWHLEQVGFSELYGYYQGNEKVRVAVVDNAVWGAHEDLQLDPDNMYDTFLGVEGDSRPPKNVNQQQQGSASNPSVAYAWSHGTHCAGVIGAITDNGKGIASLASGVTVMGVKAANDNPRNMDRCVQGVIWAAENGADVISMSYGSQEYSSVEEAVYTSCVERGIVMIAAAGNDGKEIKNYPAAYPGVVSVGSVNSDGSRASYSNYGDWVDVWAPGGFYMEDGKENNMVQIFSTTFCITQYYADKESFRGKYYDAMTGTSMATPLVASAAGLLLSYKANLNGYQVKEILSRSTRNNSIYLPDAMKLMFSDTVRQVRNLKGVWDASQRTVEIKWEAPQSGKPDGYIIYRNEEKIAEVATLSYRFQAQDTMGLFGVQAVYGNERSLTVYTSVRKGEITTSVIRNEVSEVPVYVDAASRTLEVRTGLLFDRIEIFNSLGVRVLACTGVSKVRLAAFPRGLYIGRLMKGNRMMGVFKVVL